MPIKLLQKRRISGKGILRLSPEDKGQKYYRLYLDVIRRPKNEFRNLNWNPPRGKYAFISFMKQDRILSRFALESLNEELQFIPDVAGQMQLMAKCSIDTHNTSFVNLGVSLGALPISVNNPLSEFLALDIGWDEARIVCYADTAIEVALWGQDYDKCKEPDDLKDPGGEPILPPPLVPPGEPLTDISEPYDDEDDSENTVPYPTDNQPSPPPPPPELGELRSVIVHYRYYFVFNGNPLSRTLEIYAPYYIERNADFSQLGVQSAFVENGVWDGTTYVYTEILSVGNAQGVPQFEILGVDDPTGYDPEVVVVP